MSGSEPPFAIRVLGSFSVRVRGRPLLFSRKSQRKPLQLLKVLIALGSQNVPIHQISEAIWPDSEGDLAYRACTTALHRLRKILDGRAVSLRDGRLNLNSDLCWVDAIAFARLLEEARASLDAGAVERAWQSAGEALDLYRGPFLEGEFDPPELLSAREKLHAQFLDHIEYVGRCFLSLGQNERAAALYRKGLQIDDLAEDLCRELMRCCLDQQRVTEGLVAYNRFRQMLQAKIGTEPSPETERIHRQLLELRKTGADTGASPPEPARNLAQGPPEPARNLAQGPPEPAGAREPRTERRPATVLVSRFSGHVGMSRRTDPEEWSEFMRRFKEAVTRTVESHGGIVNQFAANHFVALFGLETPWEDFALRAVRAARSLLAEARGFHEKESAMLDIPINLQLGLGSGLVFAVASDRRDGVYSASGEAVHLAEALSAHAAAGDVLVCPATRRMVSGFFETAPSPRFRMPGDDADVEAFRVLGATRARSRFEAEFRRGLSAFVNREEELTSIQGALARALAGQGQLVTLVGEPGIGKTRLLYEFERTLDPSSVTVWSGSCYMDTQSTPFAPFLPLLRAALGIAEKADASSLADQCALAIRELDVNLERYNWCYPHLLSVPAGGGEPADMREGDFRRQLEQAVAALLVAHSARAPLVVKLDDWHWADEASRSALKALVWATARARMLLLVSYRLEHLEPWSNLERQTHVMLKPLSRPQTTQLVSYNLPERRLAPKAISRVHRHTGGNPLFIEEVCRTLLEERTAPPGSAKADSLQDLPNIPGTIESVIRARMDRLGAAAREVLEVASVIGPEFLHDVLRRIVPEPESLDEALHALMAADMAICTQLTPETGYAFKHELTQMVAYDGLMLRRRPELHGQVARAMEAQHAGNLNEVVETLAYHFARSADRAKAIHYHEHAARKAAQRFAFSLAANHYSAAVRLLDTLDNNEEVHRTRTDIALRWADVAVSAPHPDLLRTLDICAQEALRSGARKLLIQLERRAGWAKVMLGDYRAGLEQLRDCVTLAQELGDEDQLAKSHNALGRAYWHSNNLSGAGASLEIALPMLERVGQSREFGNSHAYLAVTCARTGEFERGREHGRLALDVARNLSNRRSEVLALYSLAVVAAAEGSWNETRSAMERIAEMSEDVGLDEVAGDARFHLGWVEFIAGNFPAGAAAMQAAFDQVSGASTTVFLSDHLGLLAYTYARMDNIADALACIERNKAVPIERNRGRIYAGWAAALIFAKQGASRRERALEEISESIRLAREMGARPDHARSHLLHAELLRNSGDMAAAERALIQAEAMFRELSMPWWLARCKQTLSE